MIRQLCRRVLKIERHHSPAFPCPACGGKGRLIVRIDGNTPGGPSEKSEPCPACGKAYVVDIVGVDMITPHL